MEKPGPVLEGLTAAWYGFLAAGEMRFQRCACGRWRHAPRTTCPVCRGDLWSWELSARRGAVHSWTVTHQAIHPAWASETPYAVVIVAMEEPGVRLVAGWRGPVDVLRLELPVTVELETRDGGLVVPVACALQDIT
jgi:uncharacterized OB-fold protein